MAENVLCPICGSPRPKFQATCSRKCGGVYRRGRQFKRHAEHGRKISLAVAREIRKRAAAGTLLKDIGAEFGVTRQLVSAIVHGKVWKEERTEA